MKNQKGFSLIELLIVVVIIGIIAAIAIPNLLASRRASNEGSAISSLRTLHGAEVTYSATSGRGNFGDLASLNAAGLIDTVLASAVDAANAKSGYYFDFRMLPANAGVPSIFGCEAWPVTHTSVSQFAATGSRHFFIGETGVIYSNSDNAPILDDAVTRVVTGGTPLNN